MTESSTTSSPKIRFSRFAWSRPPPQTLLRWLFDREVREIVNQAAPMRRIGDTHLNLEAEDFQLRCDDSEGFTSASSGQSLVFEITFRTPISTDWTIANNAAIIHQPLIQAEITYQGRSYDGVGYCKRYWFQGDLGYWGWRFIEGEVGGGQYMVWTADASFGRAAGKYDYFKIARPDGSIVAAASADSRHRQRRLCHHRRQGLRDPDRRLRRVVDGAKRQQCKYLAASAILQDHGGTRRASRGGICPE